MTTSKQVFLVTRLTVLVLSGTLDAVEAGVSAEPPARWVTVGVVRLANSAMVEERLRLHGYNVVVIESEPEVPRDFFASRFDLDVLIVPFWDPTSRIATARIHRRGTRSPLHFERTGDRALADLGDALVEFLSTPNAIQFITSKREVSASDLRADPPDQGVKTAVFKAQQLIAAGNCRLAIEELKGALAMEAEDDQIHYNLAFCYKQVGDRTQMLYHAKEGHRINPQNGAISILMGNEYWSAGHRRSAIASYQSALLSPSTRSVANWNLAIVYGRTGNIEKLKVHLNAISTASPKYKDAQGWLASMEEAERKASRRVRWMGTAAICFLAVTTALLILVVVRQLKRALASKLELRVEIATAVISGLFTILTSLLTWIYGR
ncbi:MAG TPA: hypothetical protein VE685_22320 [Thermoanaerobaculia bacterium]|nr:hypothetical protein [Thermoanaerobaculia bacterium]